MMMDDDDVISWYFLNILEMACLRLKLSATCPTGLS